MTIRLPYLTAQDRIADAQGRPTLEFLNAWNNVVRRLGGQAVDAVADVTATTNGVVTGRVPVSDTIISGQGSVREALAVIAANSAQIAATSTGLTATPLPVSLFGDRTGPGLVVLGPVALTITGGTGPYGVVWSDPEGLGVSFGSPSGTSTTITASVPSGGLVIGAVRARVTDAASAVTDCFVSVSARDVDIGFIF